MKSYKVNLITNKFELALMVLLGLVISTRLIWLQTDNRPRILTSEYYSTSMRFKQGIARYCPNPIEPMYPLTNEHPAGPLDTDAEISMGGLVTQFLTCQVTRLSATTIYDAAPVLIGFTALIVALCARMLTSNWVAGMLAASVVLSRGSLLQGTHAAGSFLVIHPLLAMTFLAIILFARTRDNFWLPVIYSGLFLVTAFSTLLGMFALVICVAIASRAYYLYRLRFLRRENFRGQFISSIGTLIGIICFIAYALYERPHSSRAVSALLQIHLTTSISRVDSFVAATIATLELQDFHWQFSLATLILAATWRRFLPRGSGFIALSLAITTIAALYLDGALLSAAAREAIGPATRRIYNLRQAVFALEPLLIGIAAGFGWMTVRYVIMSIYPNYSQPNAHHDIIDDDQNF